HDGADVHPEVVEVGHVIHPIERGVRDECRPDAARAEPAVRTPDGKQLGIVPTLDFGDTIDLKARRLLYKRRVDREQFREYLRRHKTSVADLTPCRSAHDADVLLASTGVPIPSGDGRVLRWSVLRV